MRSAEYSQRNAALVDDVALGAPSSPRPLLAEPLAAAFATAPLPLCARAAKSSAPFVQMWCRMHTSRKYTSGEVKLRAPAGHL